MKHSIRITTIILTVFFLSQIMGLLILNNYVDNQKLEEGELSFKDLPLGFERPEMSVQETITTIIAAILIGTLIALLLIKFQQKILWKIWFIVAIFVTLNFAFKAFVPETIATFLAVILALWKVFKPNFYIQNITEFFIYGGLAAIFVPLTGFNISTAIILLFLISAYDMYAVWKSKHMIKLAEFQTKSNLFAGVIIPYKMPKLLPSKKPKKIKVRTAILGGGDIGFPLLFAGAVFKELILKNSVSIAILKVSIIPIFATIALAWLLWKADKDKYYPAMPFITLGCLAGFTVMHFLGFI